MKKVKKSKRARRITIVLSGAVGEAVEQNPSLGIVLRYVARDSILQHIEGLPRQCTKTKKPHRYYTNYDETYCKDCHKDFRTPEPNGKPYVNKIILHYRSQDGQPYGSESRKCSECGTRLWVPSDGAWTDDHLQWKNPPKGFFNCHKAREKNS